MRTNQPYSANQWRADRVRVAERKRLTCPECDFSGDYDFYGPRGGEEENGPPRRACKKCGFWQFVADPFCCWPSEHQCDRGPVGKYLTPWESGYECPDCGCWQGRDTAAEWERKGSG